MTTLRELLPVWPRPPPLRRHGSLQPHNALDAGASRLRSGSYMYSALRTVPFSMHFSPHSRILI